MKLYLAILTLLASGACAFAQSVGISVHRDRAPLQFRAPSSLVQVPTLVRTRAGALVFSLRPSAFTIRDNGVEQKVSVDGDTSQQPLALAIVVQTGGAGQTQLLALQHLQTMIEAMVGNVPHRVALITFDSKPHVVQSFTPNLADIGQAIRRVKPGDGGAGILDALAVSVQMVQKQPATMRRAVLLISGTVDHGSQTTLHRAVRLVSETNTVVYSMAFSTSKTEVKAALANTPPSPASGKGNPVTGAAETTPSETPAGSDTETYNLAFSSLSAAVKAESTNTFPSPSSKGCSQRASQSVGMRLGEHESCASLTPLVLFAARLGMDGLSRNAPQTVARMTGGEYRTFNNEKSLENGLYAFANDMPNRYILDFQPASPLPGLHMIQVTLKNYPKLVVAARTSYWATGQQTSGDSSH